jgi:hypothetical protein
MTFFGRIRHAEKKDYIEIIRISEESWRKWKKNYE